MFDKTNPPYGLVGYGDSKGRWPAILQHIFAGPGASHAFLITYPIGIITPVPMVFEADISVKHTPYWRYLDDKKFDYWLFSMPNFTNDEIIHAIDKCTNEFSSVTYGFLQWPWFVWRWFHEKVLHTDWRKKRNWFTSGVICSELWYWFVWYATELRPDKHSKIRAILEQWEPDSIQAYDVKMIMLKNPNEFKPFAERVNGVYRQFVEI